ncbi:Uncharacterised protein [uncultured archaeon]|nr:Uncharacterised protein [uncultured archaeon]
MKIYSRSSEKEFERLLINEDYQEQIEYQEDLEELRAEFWCGLVSLLKEDNRWRKIFPVLGIDNEDKKIVGKVERVMEEMQDEYGNDDYLEIEQYANYRDGEGMI